jgi:hypothetical protein
MGVRQGMGGYGSSRWDDWYTKAETVDMYPRAIPGAPISLRYARTVTAAQIRPDVDPPGTRPWYPEGDTWVETGAYTPGRWYHYDLSWQPRYKGGYELYLVCPACKRNCKTLYMRDALACRKCHGLSYTSCQSAMRPERRSGFRAALDAVHVLEKLRAKAQRTFRQLSRCAYGSIRWRKLTARMERYGRRLEHLHRLAELSSVYERGVNPMPEPELSEFPELDLSDLIASIDARELAEMDSPDFNVDVEALLKSLEIDKSPDFSFDVDALMASMADNPLPDFTLDINQLVDQVLQDLEISKPETE